MAPGYALIGLVCRRHDFQAVAETITHMESKISFKSFTFSPRQVISHGIQAAGKGFPLLKRIAHQSRMGLFGWDEFVLDAQMNFCHHSTGVQRTEPAPAAACKRWWLAGFAHTQAFDVEPAGFGFLASRHGNLNVVESHRHLPLLLAANIPISSLARSVFQRYGKSGFQPVASSFLDLRPVVLEA